MVRCAKVEKQKAEKILREIKRMGLLDNHYRIERDESFVYIPLKPEGEIFIEGIGGVVERELQRVPVRVRHYSELLSLPPELMAQLPSSFDIVGDIAIIKLPEPLLRYEKEIGSAILKAMPSIKTVLLDEGVEGDFRIRKVRWLCGEKKSRTVHREYGLRFEVDLARAYFSPRLANERQFLCSEIQSPCVVIDMFAGTGPFSITIAKRHPEARVYAIDKNPEAYWLLRKNISRNSVKNVIPICGDAAEEIKKLPEADYIIMNLPHSGENFLESALEKLKSSGKIFLYIVAERSGIEERVERIKARIVEAGGRAEIKFHEVHTYSPTSSVFGLVILVKASGSSP
ncbi:MAG: class I SAM-dependent methyltransferase family protein [Thermoplasmata archaeon]